MGAPLASMRRLFEPLFDLCTIVTWDMRGFNRSAAPRDPEAFAVEHHVADLEAVVRAAGLSRFVLGGWSMGVPISLEHYARSPSAVEGLVLINGPYEAALVGPLALPALADAVVLAAERIGGPLGRLLNPLSRSILGRRAVADALVRAGLFAQNADYFHEILDEFRHVDWSRYFTVMRRLHEHSAAAHLPAIAVPTLITAGSRDRMTPPSTARRMHALIPGSELLVVEGGTHYTPAEYPELLAARIRRFFAERL